LAIQGLHIGEIEMSVFNPGRGRFSFWLKAALAFGLVVVADQAFFAEYWGWMIGAAALAWAIGAVAVHPSVRRDRRAWIAIAVAVAMAGALFDRPNLMAWLIFLTALTLAVLLPRTKRFGDAWKWFQRLALNGLVAALGPLADLRRLWRTRKPGHRRQARDFARALIMPLVGGAVFLALFAMANPIIAGGLGDIRLPSFNLGRTLFWGFVATSVWAVFRPRRRPRWLRGTTHHIRVIGFEPGLASLVMSLVVFNAVFALQNGLDIAFLWSGARLPADLTLAEYAHRGAYPLIATALLAGLFVLIALRPGSASARTPAVRWLVVAWVAQNVFLVASSILRTLDYVDAYSLTRLRIAALAWMGLVALGLVLICWRMLRDLSAAWLINANALATALVLLAASVTDLGSVAAAWNVRHAREVGGHGVELDLCYLRRLGPSALVPLAELEQRPLPPIFAGRVRGVRAQTMNKVVYAQSDWRGWTWGNARRLARAQAILPAETWKVPLHEVSCHAAPPAPAPTPQPAVATAPLTSDATR
jgi:hypothetical protein